MLELCKRIQSRYDYISTHVALKNKKRALAEVDVIARKGRIVDLYEVKCSFRITKARKQLKRIRRLLNLPHCRSFFYCGSSKIVMEV